jgi:transcriptional regulator with XRE-family HTH domain
MTEGPSIDVEKMRDAIRAAKARGLSYRQISIGAGMAPEWARQFVNGRSESPRIDTAMGLAAALNLPISAFYSGTEALPQESARRAGAVTLQVLLPSVEQLAAAFRPILDASNGQDTAALALTLAERLPTLLTTARAADQPARDKDRPQGRKPDVSKHDNA